MLFTKHPKGSRAVGSDLLMPRLGFSGPETRACILTVGAAADHGLPVEEFSLEIQTETTAVIHLSRPDGKGGLLSRRQSVPFDLGMLADLLERRAARPGEAVEYDGHRKPKAPETFTGLAGVCEDARWPKPAQPSGEDHN